MTVKQLREHLSNFPDDTEVVVRDMARYYGFAKGPHCTAATLHHPADKLLEIIIDNDGEEWSDD